MLVEVALLTN